MFSPAHVSVIPKHCPRVSTCRRVSSRSSCDFRVLLYAHMTYHSGQNDYGLDWCEFNFSELIKIRKSFSPLVLLTEIEFCITLNRNGDTPLRGYLCAITDIVFFGTMIGVRSRFCAPNNSQCIDDNTEALSFQLWWLSGQLIINLLITCGHRAFLISVFLATVSNAVDTTCFRR